MSHTLRATLDVLPAKNPAKAHLRGEAASAVFLARVHPGRLIKRCLELAGMTEDQAGREMAYADASEVSKWIAESKAPNVIRLLSVPRLQVPFLEALAEHFADQVQVEKLIRITRRTA